MSTYDPLTFKALTFHDAVPAFRNGGDTPRAYLERCLETITQRDDVVKAYVSLNEDSARAAADASAARYKDDRPLSAIDGLPISIKDLLETKDMPTQMGCEAYAGNFPKNDNAAVRALREAGAVVLGKTVTAELGGTHPGLTTNPFNATRTPGGSSSGSAAAVAAAMVPAAIGTQVGGSIIRPAAYCGNVALKPTQGGINRGERQATSMSTHGIHANCIEDMWQSAIEIARRAGGDRGCLGLFGPDTPPIAVKPNRLIVLETAGWAILDDASKIAFEGLLENLQQAGVTLLRRKDNVLVEKLEQAIVEAPAICGDITRWENQWAQRNLVDQKGEFVSDRLKAGLALAEAMSPDDYRAALLARKTAQRCHDAVGQLADAAITLSCPGPAPLWPGDIQGQPLVARPTGDAIFNTPTSMLFAPCVTMPLLAVGGMPLGVQIVGQQHQDAGMTAIARWMLDEVAPVVIG
ncbi:MAG: amidase [Alphaproteobacteria bacterium]|jgi:Asp-tRNA(Asn)/Glu-tRNA(Gln) amidotransferase A subunit family amidase|nr:amidase [Alphaproteobacteria bacterium]MDP6253708.1 amidase [Alphaproteobacteria bacterium]MDP7055655.1 amidase [Alphaproteobacteria bacterium]MDP7229289.1 amidase [Alphaproteobacteria bacterium]MDP7460874.1 amidase [Alphaproteobacteria bacterium]|tara:strand:+ start:6534 stop:7928 length:1395 start_codon:yes stop_codon:yes gene_type:complete